MHAIIALADGHGSEKCPRSDFGSRFAVETASELCRALIDDYDHDLTAVKRFADEGMLPRNLISTWRERVDQHRAENPYSEEELRCIRLSEDDDAHGHYLAYGATLLIAVVTEDFVLYMQLGDGDIVVVSNEGHVYRPLPHDNRLIANETTSMSGTKQPWNDFRIAFQALAGTPPGLILLATDGYSNSFESDRGFLKVAPDIMNMILEHGFDAVANSIDEWLRAATAEGSGDDVTVGIAFRVSPTPSVAHEPTLVEPTSIDATDLEDGSDAIVVNTDGTEGDTDAGDSAEPAERSAVECDAATASEEPSRDVTLSLPARDRGKESPEENLFESETTQSHAEDVCDRDDDETSPS